MTVSLPDVTGLSVFDAALAYAECGIAVAPFDPAKGKGKSCWNLVGYRDITTDAAQLQRWSKQFGPFEALATSPGQFGCMVFDVDRPKACPKPLRKHLDAAVHVNTRPDEHLKRGHYWFTLPSRLQGLGNPTLPFGEVRCVGGGIVLPPYGTRRVVRAGAVPALPDELASFLEPYLAKAKAGGAEQLTVKQFCAEHTGNARPHKLDAVLGLHLWLLSHGHSPHVAMRKALVTGLGEARIGYVPARKVIATLWDSWDRDRNEFRRLVQYAVDQAQSSDVGQLRRVSDRCPGTDTRRDSSTPSQTAPALGSGTEF